MFQETLHHPPPHIHLLRFILEAYEGIGLVTTLDAGLGLVELSIAPGCEEEVARILTEETANLHLRQVHLDHGQIREQCLTG